jgi:hypothetical protein
VKTDLYVLSHEYDAKSGSWEVEGLMLGIAEVIEILFLALIWGIVLCYEDDRGFDV